MPLLLSNHRLLARRRLALRPAHHPDRLCLGCEAVAGRGGHQHAQYKGDLDPDHTDPDELVVDQVARCGDRVDRVEAGLRRVAVHREGGAIGVETCKAGCAILRAVTYTNLTAGREAVEAALGHCDARPGGCHLLVEDDLLGGDLTCESAALEDQEGVVARGSIDAAEDQQDKAGEGIIDTVVLACTHFPLLKEELAQQLPARLTLIDSGAAIARRVEFLLADCAEAPTDYVPEHIAVFTKATLEAAQLAPALTRFNIYQQAYLNI